MDSNEINPLLNKIELIPCPLCKHKMRLSMKLLISQCDALCDHCKRHIDYKQEQLKCHCKELVERVTTNERTIIDRKESQVNRIKDFFKTICRSPRLVNRTRITSLFNDNPFESYTEPNLRGDIESHDYPVRYSGSEPYLAESSEKEGEKNTQTKAKSDKTAAETLLTDALKHEPPNAGKVEDKKDQAKAKSDETAAKTTPSVQKHKPPVPEKAEDEKVKSDETAAKTTPRESKPKGPVHGKAEDNKAKSDETAAKTTPRESKPKGPFHGKAEDNKAKSDETAAKTTPSVTKHKPQVPENAEDKKAKFDETAAKTTPRHEHDHKHPVLEKVKNKKTKADDSTAKTTAPKHIPPTAGKEEDKKAKTTLETVDELGQKEKTKGKRKSKLQSELEKTDLPEFGADKTKTQTTAPKHIPPTAGKEEDKKAKTTLETVDELGQKEKTKGKRKSKPQSELDKTDLPEVGADGDKLISEKALELSDKLNKEEFKRLKEEREAKNKHRASRIMARNIKQTPKILDLIKLVQKSPRVRQLYSNYKPFIQSRYLQVKKEPIVITPRKSVLELEAMNVDRGEPDNRIIIGDKIFKQATGIKQSLDEKDTIHQPILFNVDYDTEPHPTVDFVNSEIKKDGIKRMDNMEELSEYMEGVICYALSDRHFIDKGYTKLPTQKIMRKTNVFRMHPANAGKDWFSRNKHKNRIDYPSGEVMATFDDEGRCQIFYKNGNVALDYYEAAENNARQRIVIFSNGENELGQRIPATVLATFDHMGSGVVYDKKGNIRLKYNQNEGEVLDQSLGPYTKWKWHSMNDPPVLEQVMIDTNLEEKDPKILRECKSEINTKEVDDEMIAIEINNFLKERDKLKSKAYKPFKIMSKALKINSQFSFHVMDQSKIHIKFRDGLTNMKINVGMILDGNEIIDSETAELGEVAISMDRKPARTDSLLAMQRSVAGAQRRERLRAKRDHKLRPVVEPCMSFEKLHRAASRPLRKHLETYQPTNGPAHIVCCCVNNR